jgi:hypothetical protein
MEFGAIPEEAKSYRENLKFFIYYGTPIKNAGVMARRHFLLG